MNRGVFRVLIAAIAATLIGVGVQTSAVADPTLPGSASGHVYAPNGEPVAGVKVKIDGQTLLEPTLTSADGSWSIDDLPLSTGSNLLVEFIPPGNVFAANGQGSLVLTASSPHQVLDVTLPPAFEVAGTVTGESGEPAAGLRVTVISGTGPFYLYRTETDGNGAYKRTNVPIRGFRVFVEDLNGALDSRFNGDKTHGADAPVLTAAAGTTATQNFVLGPRGHFKGTVTNEVGQPLPGIMVSTENTRSGFIVNTPTSATTGADGKYDLAAPSGSSIAVGFSGASNTYVKQYADNAPTTLQAKPHELAPHQTVTVDQALATKPRVYMNIPRGAAVPLKISGTPTVGSQLSISSTGSTNWVPTGGATTLTYQWYRDGVLIPGTSGSQRVLTGDDLGKHISARVTGSASGWNPGSYAVPGESAAVGIGTLDVLAAPFLNAYAFGQYVRSPVYSPSERTGFTATYKWYRDGNLISGTTSSHKIDKYDIGHRLSTTIVVSQPGYSTKTLTTSPTAPIALAATEFTYLKPIASGGRRVWFDFRLGSDTVSPLWLDGTIRVQEVVNGKRVTLRTVTIKDGKGFFDIGRRSAGLHVYYLRYSGVAGTIAPVETSTRALL